MWDCPLNYSAVSLSLQSLQHVKAVMDKQKGSRRALPLLNKIQASEEVKAVEVSGDISVHCLLGKVRAGPEQPDVAAHE